jgi:hypothetical protein
VLPLGGDGDVVGLEELGAAALLGVHVVGLPAPPCDRLCRLEARHGQLGAVLTGVSLDVDEPGDLGDPGEHFAEGPLVLRLIDVLAGADAEQGDLHRPSLVPESARRTMLARAPSQRPDAAVAASAAKESRALSL